MIDQLTSFVLEHRVWFGLLTIAVLAFWYFRELNDADSHLSALYGVGDRANKGAGGLLGAVGALIFIGTSLMITIGTELLIIFAQLSDLFANAPVIASNVLATGLGVGALAGWLDLSAVSFAFYALLILFVALVWRVRQRM